MKKKISQLRTFLRVSNAAHDLTNAIQSVNGEVTCSELQQLNKLALEEIEKETPDLEKIDNLLADMISLGELNNQPKPNLQTGGI